MFAPFKGSEACLLNPLMTRQFVTEWGVGSCPTPADEHG